MTSTNQRLKLSSNTSGTARQFRKKNAGTFTVIIGNGMPNLILSLSLVLRKIIDRNVTHLFNFVEIFAFHLQEYKIRKQQLYTQTR